MQAPADKLFKALTTANGIRGWWVANCQVGSAVGDRGSLRFDKDGQIVLMKFAINELEEYRRVRWTCTENGNSIWVGSTLTLELHGMGDSTEFTLTHAGISAGGPPYEMTVQGWKPFMQSLKSYVEDGEGQPSD